MIYYSKLHNYSSNDFNQYTDFMLTLPNDDDYVCFIPSNSTFTTDIYDKHLNDIVALYPEAGIFISMTTTSTYSWQVVNEIDNSNSDINYHRDIGYKLCNDKYSYCEDVTGKIAIERNINTLVLIKKSAWKKLITNNENTTCKNILDLYYSNLTCNIKVYKMDGCYVYMHNDTRNADDIKVLNKHQKREKKLLVIMAAYNSQLTIKMSVDSVLNQDYTNVQLCIVDDNSTDLTSDIIKQHYANNNRVTLYKLNINRGSYVARNVALKEMLNGCDYWVLHDADDYVYKHKFSFLLSALSNTHSLAVNCGFNRVDYYTKDVLSVKPNSENSIVYNKLIFNELGYYDEHTRYGGDSEYRNRFYAAYSQDALYKTEEILFDAYITGNNCTLINKLNSIERKQYIAKYKFDHATCNTYYKDFTLQSNEYTKIF